MTQNEEVKKILDQILIKYPMLDYPYRENINKLYAKEICLLKDQARQDIEIDHLIYPREDTRLGGSPIGYGGDS